MIRPATAADTPAIARLEWSVLKWNEPAIRFYRALGAGPVDKWAVYRLAGDALAAAAAGGAGRAMARAFLALYGCRVLTRDGVSPRWGLAISPRREWSAARSLPF